MEAPPYFWGQFGKLMVYVDMAIKSLDSLNDQLIQFIFTPKSPEHDSEHDLAPRDREKLKSSMAIMRRLLVEAQTKFRKMVDDNKRLASRIDRSIVAANEEVNALKADLADTNRRLCQIGEVAAGSDLCLKALPDNDLAMKQQSNQETEELSILREENANLHLEVASLNKQLSAAQSPAVQPHKPQPTHKPQQTQTISENTSQTTSLLQAAIEPDKVHGRLKLTPQELQINDLKLDLIQSKHELARARETLTAMKSDRKRLKSEKIELLGQMKQLYSTLQDKESELREFIRNYEQRMKECDTSIKQLASEKEDTERQKWEVLKHARDAEERTVCLQAQLDEKDVRIRKLEVDLTELSSQLRRPTKKSSMSSLSDDGLRRRSSAEPVRAMSPHRDVRHSSPEAFKSSNVTSNTSSANISSNSSANTSSLNLTPIGEHSRSSDDLHPELPNVIISNIRRPIKHRSKSPGTFSRIFGKNRSRRSLAISAPSVIDDSLHSSRLSALSQDNYQEKLKILSQARDLPMRDWKASHVLAWLEIDMNMPLYGKTCSENIKSGKVLLGLSDSDLDSALGLTSALHRRKLRLAIEELREPSLVKYPKASGMDHTWVAHRWIQDLGLPQYSVPLGTHLIDGRLLNVLSKKDMEKHLSIHRKFHQASLLHGVELLRMMHFDKEALLARRAESEDSEKDPVVWTTHRLIRWLQLIDLDEYSNRLKESGVHGAVLVLEPTFTAEAFATALGIPPAKSYVRRHLATELEALVRPARAALDPLYNMSTKRKGAGGSVGRSSTFVRSYRGGSQPEDEDEGIRGSGKRLSFRGSFGKAFGRRVKQEDDKDTDSTPIHQVASDKPKQKTKSRVRSRSEHRSRDKRHSSSTDRNSSIT